MGESRSAQRRNVRVTRFSSHDEAAAHDAAYWASVPPAARLEIVWDIVQEHAGLASRSGRPQDRVDADTLGDR